MNSWFSTGKYATSGGPIAGDAPALSPSSAGPYHDITLGGNQETSQEFPATIPGHIVAKYINEPDPIQRRILMTRAAREWELQNPEAAAAANGGNRTWLDEAWDWTSYAGERVFYHLDNMAEVVGSALGLDESKFQDHLDEYLARQEAEKQAREGAAQAALDRAEALEGQTN